MKTQYIWILFSLAQPISAQLDPSDELFAALKTLDSIIFEIGYNQVDTSAISPLLMDNVEMYHDQAGMITDKKVFLMAMQSLGALDYRAKRALVPGSLQVFPLYDRGELYGAIQRGEHEFFAIHQEDEPPVLTSTAKFTTLWILEDGIWKMKRVLSFDHQSP